MLRNFLVSLEIIFSNLDKWNKIIPSKTETFLNLFFLIKKFPVLNLSFLSNLNIVAKEKKFRVLVK